MVRPSPGPEDDATVIRTAHFSPPPHAAAFFRMEAGRSCSRPPGPRPSSGFSGLATDPAPVPAAERMLRLHDTSAEPADFVAGARERAAVQHRQNRQGLSVKRSSKL
ncbi:hypothetical protein [Streptomyces azureus]|uniref:Uncharacterized protein n=1 Tax=Streptomyces azureus TaxID=146537 RepID=A0A0K8PN36_STRAJ|nr:hypothetical protein [Streptomyces azureus]GAP49295.1 putative uncharacterized protein [Streptomyces azureus]